MRVLRPAWLLLLAISAEAIEDDTPSKSTPVPACTATASSGSGAFFDLRPDIAVLPDKSKSHWTGVTKDYHARGWDYGKNFTLNICSPVLETLSDVKGLDEHLWANVSAYYTSFGKVYSLGSQSKDLKSRGRKLVLQYTGGSPCGEQKSSLRSREDGMPATADDEHLEPPLPDDFATLDGDHSVARRKSTTISFLCDHDPVNTQATLAFVGTPDECAYFFEARSIHACAHAEPHKPGSVGPSSIFGLILVIAVLVYVLGGVFYNRTVTHARGWRQIPNFSLWNGMWSFICDMSIIAVSSCARFLPSRSGYSALGTGSSRRERNAEAENRLIDQLDEEWDE